MSEANSVAGAVPASGGIQTDAMTGEIVGGLAGLRELVRAKQEQLRSGGAVADVVSGRPSNDRGDDGKRKRRRGSRRGKNNNDSDNGTAANDLVLDIKPADIIYARMVLGDDSRAKDVYLYVMRRDQLVIYSAAMYDQQRTAYCRAVRQLLHSDDNLLTVKAAGQWLFVRRGVALTPNSQGFVYRERYQIMADSAVVRAAVMNLLDADDAVGKLTKPSGQPKQAERPKQTKQAELEKKPAELEEAAKQTKSAAQSKEAAMTKQEVIDKVLAVQQVARRANQAGRVTEADAMTVFLNLGEANARLLQQVLCVDEATAESLIDQLRLMHALGVKQADQSYPILIDQIDQLGDDVGYTLQTQTDNFRSVVRRPVVRGRKLLYDLDELCMVKAADEYIEHLADFCRASNSQQLRRLWSSSDETVKVSVVLRAISADESLAGLNTADYQLFHQYVTYYMLAAGWLVGNPSDGFPWFQFQVEQTDGLKIDTLRYLLANLNWLLPIYDDQALASCVAQINNVQLPDQYGAAQLRAALTGRIERYIKRRQNSTPIDRGQLDLTEARPAKK